MKPRIHLLAALVAVLLLGAAPDARAEEYTLEIAIPYTPTIDYYAPPGLSDDGTVIARFGTTLRTQAGIVVQTGDMVGDQTLTTLAFTGVSMSGNGTPAFKGYFTPGGWGIATPQGVLFQGPQTYDDLTNVTDGSHRFMTASINNADTVVFFGSGHDGAATRQAVLTQDEVVFHTGRQVEGTTITALGYFSNAAYPVINNAGDTAFLGRTGATTFTYAVLTPTEIIVRHGEVLDGRTVSLSGLYSAPAINTAGDIAFSASNAIFLRKQVLVKNGDVIDGYRLTSVAGKVDLNDHGEVAFASYSQKISDGAFARGVFTTQGLVAGPGTLVDGTPIRTITGYPAINNRGQLAFYAFFQGVGTRIVLATPPTVGGVTLEVPDSIVQECDTGHSAASVNFDVTVVGTPPAGSTLTVTDTTSGRTLLSQAAAAGTVSVGPYDFPPGPSTIDVEITDGGTSVVSRSFTVQIDDTVQPSLAGCASQIIECTGPLTFLDAGALGISAGDACDPDPAINFVPEAIGLGTTSVTVTATDHSGNISSPCTIDITVQDTTPPEFVVCPEDIQRECDRSDPLVAFDVLAVDLCGDVTFTCVDQTGRTVDPMGTHYAVGMHTITCTATDPSGNYERCRFDITVVDTIGPSITVEDISTPTEPGECFAFVDFEVTVTDQCDPSVPVTCTAPWGEVEPGDAFPLGLTTVTCMAADTAGNPAQAFFGILVLDQEKPKLECPDALTFITNLDGDDISVTPYSLNVTATDNCDVDPVLACSPTVLSVGTTTVTCTATDDDSNVGSCDIAVTVQSPGQAGQTLVDSVVAAGLEGGTENSLTSKLEGAIAKFDSGHGTPGINKLGAFINEVEAQRGKTIDEDTANALIAAAQAIIDAVQGN